MTRGRGLQKLTSFSARLLLGFRDQLPGCGSSYNVSTNLQQQGEQGMDGIGIPLFIEHARLEEVVGQLEKGIIRPNSTEYGRLLQACGDAKALLQGTRVHAAILRAGYNQDMFLDNHIVNMYSKCGSVDDARRTFDEMQQRNVFSWTVMMTAYARYGHSRKAIQLYEQMQLEGVIPNDITFVTILGAFDTPALLGEGRQVHAHIEESGLKPDVILGNAIVSMYGKCGSLEDARAMFAKMPELSVASWNGLITIDIQHGHLQEAIQVFRQMKLEGMKPTNVTLISILNACDGPIFLAEGQLVHSHAFESGLEADVAVGNAILSMYGKCGSLQDASTVFNTMQDRNVISWSAMIGAYAGHDDWKQALKLFQQMQQEGIKPNEITFTNVVNVCCSLKAGKLLYSCILESGCDSIVLGTGLIDMYSKCGSLEDACEVFGRMQRRNVVSWTSIIAAYAQHGQAKESFQAFQQMQLEGIKLDNVSFITLLDICASKATLARGKLIHAMILETKLKLHGVLGTALLNMYGKCGSTENARKVFDAMPAGHLASWNALIAAYAQHGHVKEALDMFLEMKQEGTIPDNVTFVSILSAFSHAGSVDQSHTYFVSMLGDHGITPGAEHYGCMLDVLCRAGRLAQAEDVIKEMPFEPSMVAWMTLLSACKVHGDTLRARDAAEQVVELDPRNASVYAVVASICSVAENWNDAGAADERASKAADEMNRKICEGSTGSKFNYQ